MLPEFGLVGQDKLAKAHVLLVGAGGLGAVIVQYLAAAGIGKITLVDGDVVDISNLSRQICYGLSDVGKSKAKTLANSINERYQSEVVFPIDTFVDATNWPFVFAGDINLVIDGSDNFDTRYLVSDITKDRKIPLVSGALAQFESQVSVFNYQGNISYRDIFPEPSDEKGCAIGGVWTPLVGTTGMLMVNETLKILTEVGEVLYGKLMLYNAKNNQVNIIKVIREEGNKPHENTAEGRIDKQTLAIWQKNDEVLLVDVQEEYEHEENPLSDTNITVYTIPGVWQEMFEGISKKIVFTCPNGIRSKIAYQWLRDKVNACYYLTEH